MIDDKTLAVMGRELDRRGKILLGCEASAEIVTRHREGSLEIVREFFNTLGIYRDPMRAMG